MELWGFVVYSENEIASKLENYTIENSNFEESRDYISMSHYYLSAEELIAQYENGFEADKKLRLRCYKGYQMERDMVERLWNVFDGNINDGGEIEAFGGVVKGHPDFNYEGYPGDVKSVLRDDWLPEYKVPYKVYCQMQAYMMFSNRDKSIVIYESRESGLIKVFCLKANKRIQRDIYDKLKDVVNKLDSRYGRI